MSEKPGFHIVLVDHFLKTKKENKNSKKQEIHNMFIKTNQIKLAFNINAKNLKCDGYQRGLASMMY